MKAVLPLLVFLLVDQGSAQDYRKAAQKAAAWLDATVIRKDSGLAWPVDPAKPQAVSTNLYSGTPGIALFYLQLHLSTNDKQALVKARGAADYLLAELSNLKDSGLYTGLAGVGFVLHEVYKVTRDDKYRAAALRVSETLRARAQAREGGIEWNDTTDIISGGAGIGLFLLYAAREMKAPGARDLALQAGQRLIELAKPADHGLNWPMNPTYPRDLPNFSHGTAGVAYFLATLYQETGRKHLLAAAESGANHLLAIAKTDGDTFCVRHHTPGGEDLFYLGWCHGPAGTARLFQRLYQATENPRWLDLVHKSAKAILASGIPEKPTPGFWNNVGQCCGSAGVAEFILSLARVSKNAEYEAFVRRLTSDLLARATAEGPGQKWIHAEHRVQPDLLSAQTGYMQGAAGIGMWLLRLDAHHRGRSVGITFPDSPF